MKVNVSLQNKQAINLCPEEIINKQKEEHSFSYCTVSFILWNCCIYKKHKVSLIDAPHLKVNKNFLKYFMAQTYCRVTNHNSLALATFALHN